MTFEQLTAVLVCDLLAVSTAIRSIFAGVLA